MSYQQVDGASVPYSDEEGGAGVREAQFSEAGIKDKVIEQARLAAQNHPKFVCLFLAILALIIFHYFTLWLPTLIFWFILIPGACVGALYFLMQSGMVPAVLTDKVPSWLGGTVA
mmetsp:Transcript_50107/g.80868  ORF Transcript_50107/g.80868 Transcript_50107/m.80868 type:complete len:115 (+) Transcript_50107:23-367(+)